MQPQPRVTADTDAAGLDFLRAPAKDIFNRRQLEFLLQYESPPDNGLEADYPVTLFLILKATRLCNLRCTYCHAWREGPDQVMEFGLLVDVIAQAMRLPKIRWLHIVWHGGETTLLSRRFFERALWLQEFFRVDDRKVGHAIQTNATLIDAEWARFFKACGFSVGVSLDFDPVTHDRTRHFRDGSGSFAATRAGMDVLAAHEVPFGALAVVDSRTIALGAQTMLDRLVAEGLSQVGVLNALPANESDGNQPYLEWNRYTGFLRSLFQAWHGHFRDKVVIRELDSLYRIVLGSSSRLCIFQGGCMGQYLTIEPDGRVSACDKYVGDTTHLFGRLQDNSLLELLHSSPRLKEAREEASALLRRFADCPHYAICRGGCPHDARLNMQHGRNDDCCGLSDLIEDMKSAGEEENCHGEDNDGPGGIRKTEDRKAGQLAG
jgi:uncharacterized protein